MRTMILLSILISNSSFGATISLERGEYFHTGTMIDVPCGVTHWGSEIKKCEVELYYACKRVCANEFSKTVECQPQPLCQSDAPCGGRHLAPGETDSFVSPQGISSTVSCSSRTYLE